MPITTDGILTDKLARRRLRGVKQKEYSEMLMKHLKCSVMLLRRTGVCTASTATIAAAVDDSVAILGHLQPQQQRRE
jgi:hypothetical protein